MKVVIMAGGKGTRISSVASDIPKPMILIDNRPILEHELLNLKAQGFNEIIIVTGHLGNIIENYFKDGSKWGIHIEYYHESTPLGTAGSLYDLKDVLSDDFLLLNGDIVFDVDFEKMIAFHTSKKADATLLTHPNSHPYDSALIITDENKKVLKWLNKEEPRTIYKNRVNAGIHIISRSVIEKTLSHPGKYDLDRDILKPLVSFGNVYAYDSPEYVKDMGTPERYYSICQDFIEGRIHRKNLKNPQRSVFLDRDGTINKYKGFITDPSQMELLPCVAEAIKKINDIGYLAIVITNQPVIARGDCTLEELEQIHLKMETLLGEQGAYLDDIFFCPHHPDKGFEGEREEYKIECSCRKPKPGMLLQAAQKYNIDLKSSYMIGDSLADVQAGNAAGCKSILIGKPKDGDFEYCKDLLEFVKKFIGD